MPTTVTGNIKDLSGTSNTAGVAVQMSLKWAGGGIPRVNGTTLLASQNASGAERLAFQLTVNPSTGAITGTVYSTRDAAGTGNGEIEINGSLTSCYYEVQLIKNGRTAFSFPVHAKNGVSLDLTSVTPITVSPVVVAPTGDTTYARLDGGNAPFTGQVVGKNGTVASPSFAFASSLGTGFWRQAADVIGVSIAGVLEWLANASGLLFSSGDAVGWSSNADPSLAAGDSFLSRLGAGIIGVGTALGNALGTLRAAILQIGGSDTGLTRDSAGVIDVGNGTQGDKSGSLNLTNITATGTVNKVAITAPATGATLTIADGKTFTASKTFTFTSAGDGLTMTFPSTSATIARTDAANTFTGHQTIEGVTSTGATGTGKFVFDAAPTVSSPTVNTGVSQGSGVKHQRFGASCTTAASAGSLCSSTLTWTSAFADANYTVSCVGSQAGGVPILTLSTKLAASIAITVWAATASAAQFASVDCIAMHD
jgi:hypothetical protein